MLNINYWGVLLALLQFIIFLIVLIPNITIKYLQENLLSMILYILAGILISIILYIIFNYFINNIQKLLHITSFKCPNIFGLIFSIIHLLIVSNAYRPDLVGLAQYQLSWMYVSIIDFPITSFFFILQRLYIPVNISGVIIFGIFGTLMWYILVFYIADKFCKS